MDPTENLKEQLTVARVIQAATDQGEPVHPGDADRLAELVTTLHRWFTKAGYLPAQWDRPRPARRGR